MAQVWTQERYAAAIRNLPPEQQEEAYRLLQVIGSGGGHVLPGADVPWEQWLRQNFAQATRHPMGERHRRLWEWFEALTPKKRPRPRVDAWPRGGGKSSSLELGCVRACVKLSRRYALIVSGTQDQADKHVQSIATFMEQAGVERSLNRYGNSKGWRRNELRTSNGFNVSAYGLDVAVRGVKIDEYRPDWVAFDDVDSIDDSTVTRDKKIRAITSSIIPAGAEDCAYLFLQNPIYEDSIVSMLIDGRAEFLLDREAAFVEPAVRDLEVAPIEGAEGIRRWKITGGKATWAGQNLARCQEQINAWGLEAFKREAQHEVKGAQGIYFDVDAARIVEYGNIPANARWCRAWDLAATRGAGDWTVGVLMAMRGVYPNVQAWIVDVIRGQWSSDEVRRKIGDTARDDGPDVLLRIPQDPAQAGKAQAEHLQELLFDYHPKAEVATGKKWVRARGLQAAWNVGNVFLVRGDWNRPLKDEFRQFREGVVSQLADEVDASSDAFNELAKGDDGPPPPPPPKSDLERIWDRFNVPKYEEEVW